MTEQRIFTILNAHPDYEMTTSEPWIIKRKSDGKIVNPWFDKSNGYFRVYLNQKKFYLHRIVAEQLLPNPDNLPEIDHRDRCRTNNTLTNLRWVSNKVNQNNLTSMKKIRYEYFNELPEGYELFTQYQMKSGEIRHFDNLYVNFDDEIPKFISYAGEHQYRQLYVWRNMVQCHDSNGKYCHICFSRINKQQLVYTTTIETTTTTFPDGKTETKTKTIINKYETQKDNDESDDDDEIDEKIIDDAVEKLRPKCRDETDDEEYEPQETEEDYHN
jgi:hypothetical protein